MEGDLDRKGLAMRGERDERSRFDTWSYTTFEFID
jgi:hypothetical protein